MYSDKKNILQLAALLKGHGIRQVVLCPGSRNAAIVHTLTQVDAFTCYQATDERSAGFLAIGLSVQSGETTAVCCTSGSALLNLHPAVAEAFYQQIPMVVISADRPAAWIGQMDGQTLPQPGVFGPLVKMSVNLPEIHTVEEEWFCNRLLNEALLETHHHGEGPVHINVPVSEPIYNFTVSELPRVRMIRREEGLDCILHGVMREKMENAGKRMVIWGQMPPEHPSCSPYIQQQEKQFLWLSEHLGNFESGGRFIGNFDAALHAMSEDKQKEFTPDLLITCGGHIVSKQLKKLLRKYPPKIHWHISKDGKVADLFGSLDTVVEADPYEFFRNTVFMADRPVPEYPSVWERFCRNIPQPVLPYSQIAATGKLLAALPVPSILHLANSSTVRYAQLFPLKPGVRVCCNRGVNGIEGSLSAAAGCAAASPVLNFVCIGDLSFFYDMNALWNPHVGPNLRIMLLNNGGGGIFQTLPGIEKAESSHRYIVAEHRTSAEGWAGSCGFRYMKAEDSGSLEAALEAFTAPEETGRPILLEVFTDKDTDTELLRKYYQNLKNHKTS